MRMRFERLMENWTDSIALMEFMSKFKLTTTLARELSVYDACEGESTIINLVYFNNGDEMSSSSGRSLTAWRRAR